jgi:hypothetical protein
MGGIPLPALAIQPQQQQDPLAAIKNVLALRNIQTQQQIQQGQLALQPGQQAQQAEGVKQAQMSTQMQQLQLQDMQGFNSALKDTYAPQAAPAQPQGQAAQPQAAQQSQNPEDRLADLAQRIQDPKYGISMAGQIKAIEQFTNLKKSLAGASDEQIKSIQDAHSLMARSLGSVLQAPEQQRPQEWTAQVQSLMQNPALRPFAGIVPAAYPGDAKAQQLMLQLQVEKDAVDSAKLPGAKAESQRQAQQADIVQQLSDPAKLAEPGAVAAIQAKMRDPATDKADIPRLQALIPQAVAAQQQAQQNKVDIAKAEGWARANVELQVKRGSNAALAQVPPELIAPATAAATKAGTEYAAVASQLGNVKNLLAAAKNGDEVASAFAPIAAALGSNAFYGTHRLAPSEVQALGPQLGSVARELNTWFDKHATGTLAPDSIKEFNGLVDRLGSAAEDKYTNALSVANQNYGSTFKPVTMQSRPTEPTKPAIPQGATHTAMGSDKKLHYTNAQGQDLGVAPSQTQ